MSEIPEIPYPYRPAPSRPDPAPGPAVPRSVPLVSEPDPNAYAQLFERRVVFVRGRLDEPAVTELCAQLMTLDAGSSRPVKLLVNSGGGPLADVFALLDTMALVRPTVDTTCVGEAVGTAAAVVALGSGTRLAARSAALCLRLAAEQGVDGDAQTAARHAERLVTARRTLATLLAERTGRPLDEVEEWLDDGAFLGAEEAVGTGLVDAVAGEHEP